MNELNKLIEKKLFKLRVKFEYELEKHVNTSVRKLEKRIIK